MPLRHRHSDVHRRVDGDRHVDLTHQRRLVLPILAHIVASALLALPMHDGPKSRARPPATKPLLEVKDVPYALHQARRTILLDTLNNRVDVCPGLPRGRPFPMRVNCSTTRSTHSTLSASIVSLLSSKSSGGEENFSRKRCESGITPVVGKPTNMYQARST